MRRLRIVAVLTAALWLATGLASQAQACMYCAPNLGFWIDYILGPFGTYL